MPVSAHRRPCQFGAERVASALFREPRKQSLQRPIFGPSQVRTFCENAPVAQLDRASDYESEGRTFESFRARQISTIQNKTANPATAPAPSTFASFRSNRKAKITAGWSSLQFDPYAALRLPARRQHHRWGWVRTRSEAHRVGIHRAIAWPVNELPATVVACQ